MTKSLHEIFSIVSSPTKHPLPSVENKLDEKEKEIFKNLPEYTKKIQWWIEKLQMDIKENVQLAMENAAAGIHPSTGQVKDNVWRNMYLFTLHTVRDVYIREYLEESLPEETISLFIIEINEKTQTLKRSDIDGDTEYQLAGFTNKTSANDGNCYR